MWDTLKEYLRNFFSSRLLPVSILFILLFGILVNRMFDLQIVSSDEIIETGSDDTSKPRVLKATRGNIYDCNGKLLAYNKLSYNVIFDDTTAFSQMENDEKNSMIYKMLQIIEKNGGELAVEFYIGYNKNGEPEYTVEGSSLLRFLADVYSVKGGVDALTQEQQEIPASEVYKNLREGGSNECPNFEIDEKYDDETALKIMAVRYAMFINRYTKYEALTISKDVDDVTVAAIKENSAEMPGVGIAQDTIRAYKKSKYFAHILGYTGAISSEKLEELQEEDPDTDYTADDQIGISGLESTYEEELRGKNGSENLTISASTSRIVSVSDRVEPETGNDLYLSIDADLQEECYKLLEEHLASILISNINNSADAGTRGVSTKDIKVPIYDVYNALIQNNIIDVTRFTEKDASVREKTTLRKYKRRRETVIRKMKRFLAADSTVTSGSLSDDMEDFLDYFYTALKDNEIVLSDEIDTSDSTYKAYSNGNISLSRYLQYAISENWVDLSVLNIGNDYYSTAEIYQKLVDYGIDLLENDIKFTKMVYSYLVYHYELSGTDCCLLLFDQGNIKYNEEEYNQLVSGALSPYSFLIRKIRKLEITPGQLGLEPCSGSVVVTDVNTGKVKAMVTYPSYDNNKMANKVDSEYFYTYLTQTTSSPLLNRPTQQEIAPGSTFKMISAVTALEEGIISPSTTIYDRTVFDKITPSPRCWSSSSHGSVNAATAIEHSCNYFFYTVGYMLSGRVNGVLNNERGLSRLEKYADMFGLTDKSGVEITESEPHFSTEDAVRSAIGQGSHSYAPAQLARYVTTIANTGTCYNLTLVDKVTDVDGKTIKKNSAEVRNKVDIAQSTWDTIQRGMYLVVNGGSSSMQSIFGGLKTTVAGKTGTAQQNTYHANHAYFLSYAPYKNPEISVTCVIPNGYASANAASTVSDIYKYYFNGKKKVSGKGITASSYAVTD